MESNLSGCKLTNQMTHRLNLIGKHRNGHDRDSSDKKNADLTNAEICIHNQLSMEV